MIPYFKDKRYIKVDGKPFFIIYKSSDLPDIERTITVWREEAKLEGLELYICRMERGNEPENKQELMKGFDAAVDFQPGSSSLKKYREKKRALKGLDVFNKVKSRISYELSDKLNKVDLKEFVELKL